MSKLELKTFVNSVQPLSDLAKQKLPLKCAYRLRKIIEAVNNELDFFAQERAKILEEAGDWNTATITQKNEINGKIEKLLAFEVEFFEEPLVLPMDIDVNMSASDLELVKDFIQIKDT